MPKIHTDFEQGSVGWYTVRLGRVTASEVDALVTPTFKAREGEGVKTYLYKKLAEKYTGKVLDGFSSWETEQGQLLEDEARKWYAFTYGEKLTNVSFVESDDGRGGCSPDALIGDDGGLELKCPQAPNHTRYLMEGVLPKDYAAQVHMSLYVTGRKWWKFVSYRRGLPPFVLTVKRDETIMEKIGAALAPFYAQMDAGMQRLQELDKAA